jgi:hypothetical protein
MSSSKEGKQNVEFTTPDNDNEFESDDICPICMVFFSLHSISQNTKSFFMEDRIVTTNVILGLDVLEDAVSTPCHHFFCRSCITKYISQSLEQKQIIIRIDSDEEDAIQTSCPVCRAPLV